MARYLAPWKNRNALAALGLAVAMLVVLAPAGLGLSTGASKESIQDPNFAAKGCTACHGGNAFAAGGLERVSWTITGADGKELAGNAPAKGAAYTIAITLAETNAPTLASHAGFNLRASGGKLAGVAGISQATADGTQATHVGPGLTSWQVAWTAPEDDTVVSFTLFVNDVDGSNAPDSGDLVYRADWYLTNSKGDVAGAVVEHEVHFGISLQQYWIGLIGLAGMILVMVAGFVYLKFGSPHNSDQKDR
ncbi:MAG: choice-of-anchor V domain-containing protein [Candidatus Thermoplasmatota archaeon]